MKPNREVHIVPGVCYVCQRKDAVIIDKELTPRKLCPKCYNKVIDNKRSFDINKINFEKMYNLITKEKSPNNEKVKDWEFMDNYSYFRIIEAGYAKKAKNPN